MTKRLPRTTTKLVLKMWRGKLNTADIAKRLGLPEAEIVKILEIAREDERNKNRDRKAAERQSTMESVKGRGGISVPRLRCLEEGGGLGNSRTDQGQNNQRAI